MSKKNKLSKKVVNDRQLDLYKKPVIMDLDIYDRLKSVRGTNLPKIKYS